MAFMVVGINHRTASLELRERVAFTEDLLPDACLRLANHPAVREVVILSTCNRTEIYCDLDETAAAGVVLHWLCELHRLDIAEVSDASYLHLHAEAVRHLMRVACGLDSMVLGEPQILGQLKTSYAQAKALGTTGAALNRLFEQAFAVAKKVRTQTAIGENPVSVAYAAVAMARHIFTDLSRNRALLIGAGKTIELVARHLQEAGVREMIVVNRTLARAEQLASLVGGQASVLSDLPDLLHQADIVIASTASPLPVLGKGTVERALKRRKHKPMFMVDIAVPRDIEPEVGDLDDVYLYSIDDLRGVIEENLKSRAGAAEEAEHMILAGCSDFMGQMRALEAVDTLKLFRETAEQWRDQELAKALRALRNGADPEMLLRGMARGLTNKLIHEPSVQLRKATAEGRTQVTEWLRELYQLRLADNPQAASTGTPPPDAEADAAKKPAANPSSAQIVPIIGRSES